MTQLQQTMIQSIQKSHIEQVNQDESQNAFNQKEKTVNHIYLFIYIILVRERDGDMPLIRANI